MINIGQYIETAINWLTEHFASFFDALSMGIGGFIDGFQHVLFGIPFYITIAVGLHGRLFAEIRCERSSDP